MRLSISNSKGLIFVIILLNTALGVFLVEYFYKRNHIPVYYGKNSSLLISQSQKTETPTLFILGDSRAEAGIIPSIIDKSTMYNAYNIGLDGIYRGYYYQLKSNSIIPDKIIMVVSPYSVFNDFRLKKENVLIKTLGKETYSKLKIIRKLNTFTENYLNNFFKQHTHLYYGITGVLDVLNYNNVSDNYTSKGWHGYDRLGSDAYYTYMVNLESYKNKIIEEYKDSNKIKNGKRNFEDLLRDMKKNEISVLLVRIPTSSGLREIEDSKYSWFTSYINETAKNYEYKYIEFNDFIYPKKDIDGSHLNRNSAYKFTEDIIKVLRRYN